MHVHARALGRVGRAEDVCIDIEGGKFDAASIYVQMMRREIRNTKEEVLKLFDASDTLELPKELQEIPRGYLLDSNLHDACFQSVLTRMVEEHEKERMLTRKDGDTDSLKWRMLTWKDGDMQSLKWYVR